MKVEIRLLIGLAAAVLVFVYEWLCKSTLDWYPSIVAFAVVYFLAPYVFTRSFFFGNRGEQNQQEKEDSKKRP